MIYRKSRLLFKRYRLENLIDADYKKRVSLIESISKEYDFIPETKFTCSNGQLICQQERVRSAKVPKSDEKILALLKRLADDLEILAEINCVHGDINRKNVIYNGQRFILVDWEPSLIQKRNNKYILLYTPPYISKNDFLNSRLTVESDKIGYYFFCKKTLNKDFFLNVREIMENRYTYRKGQSHNWINILPMEEEDFLKRPYENILDLAQQGII
jgi:hypothetical protein